MISFNIFGDCVSRDILSPIINRGEAQVLQFVAFSSPLSVASAKPEQQISLDNIERFEGRAFNRRCMLLDINNTCLDYLFKKKSDYLIIDILDSRWPLLKKGDHYITLSTNFRKNLNNFEDFFDMKKYSNIDVFEDIKEEQWEDAIQYICEEIQKHYSPSQIIINKHYACSKWCSKNGLFDFAHKDNEKMDFSKVDAFYYNSYGIRKINELANRLFPILINNLKGCHVIKFPDYTIADSAHKWGLNPLHYTPEHYEYGSKAIEIICERNSNAEEQRKLAELWELYCEKNELKLLKYENASLKARNNGLTNAVNFTKALVYDRLENDNFTKWMEGCASSGKKVAVLKCRDIAGQILHNMLNKYNIEIIMESACENFSGLSSEEIELCQKADIIICADVHSTASVAYGDMKAIRISDLVKESGEMSHITQ